MDTHCGWSGYTSMSQTDIGADRQRNLEPWEGESLHTACVDGRHSRARRDYHPTQVKEGVPAAEDRTDTKAGKGSPQAATATPRQGKGGHTPPFPPTVATGITPRSRPPPPQRQLPLPQLPSSEARSPPPQPQTHSESQSLQSETSTPPLTPADFPIRIAVSNPHQTPHTPKAHSAAHVELAVPSVPQPVSMSSRAAKPRIPKSRRAKQPLKALDLFSGTGSVAETLRRRGYLVVTVDNDPRRKADIQESILEWDVESMFRPGEFDIVAASPPCTEYSVALSTRQRRLDAADDLVSRTKAIIAYLKPRLWWIENPRWGLLRTRPVVRDMEYIDLDYCQFSTSGFQKPTRFWCCEDIARRPSVVCDHLTCANLVEETNGGKPRRHRLAISCRGRRAPRSEDVLKIPPAIVEYLCGFPKRSEASPTETQPKQPNGWDVVRRRHRSRAIREVYVMPWHLQHGGMPFSIGKIEQRGRKRQLLMEVEATVHGVKRTMRVLIDTGAQANLVRQDLFPGSCFKPARRPLALSTVSGDMLPGGQREIRLKMTFATETEDGNPVDGGWKVATVLHDADIGCDAILGYEWLVDNKINVKAWTDALQLEQPPKYILRNRQQRQLSTKTTAVKNALPMVTTSDDEDTDPGTEDVVSLDEVRTMRLSLPKTKEAEAMDEYSDGMSDEEEEITDEETLMEVARVLRTVKKEAIGRVILAENEVQSPLATQLQEALLRDYANTVFRESLWPHPPVRGAHGPAKLYLKPGAKPVTGRAITLSGPRLEAMRELEAEWKADHKVEPGRGPWRAVAFPIKKKNGKWRGVVDFNKTNQEIQDDSYPLPQIPHLLVEQGGCHIFSVMDLRDAFHQVRLDAESRPITNTQLPGGLFQWTVVPQGIKVGPPLLQRDVDATLSPVASAAKAYFDDINVGTRKTEGMSEEDLLRAHDADLRKTLDQLAKDKWVVDPKKCRFFATRVEFCGHVMGNGELRPAPGKMMAVQKWTPPPNITALRAFLGLCNYYSSYVHMYAEYAAPLQEKLKVPREQGKAGSKAKVEWSPVDLAAFNKLKEVLVNDLLLYHLNPMKPFGLRTDASDYAVGAALEQFPKHDGVPPLEEIVKPGVARPVAFMSRKLTAGQMRKWDTRDKETYAIVSALTKWASWIGYQPVVVVTDHKTLESWYKEAFSQAMGPSARRARWHSTLSLFRVEVVYHPGKKNIVGDGLSRWGYPASEAWADVSKHGNAEDAKAMKELIRREIEEERGCRLVCSKATKRQLARRARRLCVVRLTLRPGPDAAAYIAGVTTRSKAATPDPMPPTAPKPNQVPKPSAVPTPSPKTAMPKPKPAPKTGAAHTEPTLTMTPAALTPKSKPSTGAKPVATEEPVQREQDPSAATGALSKPKPGGAPKQAPCTTQISQRDPDPQDRDVTTTLSSTPSTPPEPSLRHVPPAAIVHPASPAPPSSSTSLEASLAAYSPAIIPSAPAPSTPAPYNSWPRRSPRLAAAPDAQASGSIPKPAAALTPRAPSVPESPSEPRGHPSVDDRTPDVKSVMDADWDPEYKKCNHWGGIWYDVNTPGRPWPRGFRLENNKLLDGGRWCVPTGLTGRVLREHHAVCGHVGGLRLWEEAARHYVFANPDAAWKLAERMIGMCETCQACEHQHQSLRLPMVPTPIPPTVMSSVSIDLFQMPAVVWEGVEYDAFAACVDRLSGWIVATPHKLKGLTAAKVAKTMYERWWSPHGLPSVVTSDRGPHFAGAWWRTMCALHGVRQAYSQAYHHAANGRAEVAGEQIQKRLRKLQAEEGICWVPALQRAVQQIHDVPGQSGLSPYQILYGRDRPMAGIPYKPPKVMPDAMAFFKSQREMDAKIAKTMGDLHVKRAEQVNAHRREASALQPGDKVWWLRPRGRTGEKLESYWVGPSVVRKRVGEHSYMVQVAEGRVILVHRCHLKPYVEDILTGQPVKLFKYKQAVPQADSTPDEWLVEKIKNHRRNAEGDWEFLVKWQDSEQCTWEPLDNFFHEYADHFIKYCHEHRLRPDVVEHLLRHPAEVAVLKRSPVMVQVVRAIQVALGDGNPTMTQDAHARTTAQIWEEPPEDWEVSDIEVTNATHGTETREGLETKTPRQAMTTELNEKSNVSQVRARAMDEITEMQVHCIREFDMQSGQAVRPPPGTQENRNSKRSLEVGVGRAVGPPGAPTQRMPPEPEKDTMTLGVKKANNLSQMESGHQCEIAEELKYGTAFRSGSMSRTRSRAAQPTRWL